MRVFGNEAGDWKRKERRLQGGGNCLIEFQRVSWSQRFEIMKYLARFLEPCGIMPDINWDDFAHLNRIDYNQSEDDPIKNTSESIPANIRLPVD